MTAVMAEKLEKLLAAADRNDGRYECPDIETFRYILEEGGVISAIRNISHEGQGFKTQCVLHDPINCVTRYFCVFTQSPIEW
jgi:hypothetical protein